MPPLHYLCEGALPMISDLLFYKLLLVGLLWLCILLHVVWPSERAASCPITPPPTLPRRPPPPSSPPPLLVFTRGRRRTIDTQQQFCPDQECSYYDWTGRGNLRSNGHPGGKPWRQFQCVSCHGYFQQTHGTIFHGKWVSSDMLVWAVGTLAEGLGSARSPGCSRSIPT